jgi:hypothetical protein
MSLKEPKKKLNNFHVCKGQVSLKKPLKSNLQIVQSWVSLKNIRKNSTNFHILQSWVFWKPKKN